MQYISIYRLAELCDVNTDRLDIFSTRDIQSALKKLYTSDDLELYKIGDHPITLANALDFLWKANSSDTLTFCQWVHEVPGLEYYLETKKLNLELPTQLPNKIIKSFNFSRFANFLSDYLEPTIFKDVEVAFNQKDFKSLNALIHFKPLLSRHKQSEFDDLIRQKLLEFNNDLLSWHSEIRLENEEYLYLSTAEFKDFIEGLTKNLESDKIELKENLSAALSKVQNESNRSIVEQISNFHGLRIKQNFETPEIKIFHDKPVKKQTTTTSSQRGTLKPKQTTRVHPPPPKPPKKTIYPKTSSGSKISPWHFIGIAFAVFALIFKIAMRNTESSYDYNSYDFPDYGDSDFGSSDYFSGYNWDNSLDIIKAYVEENENLNNRNVKSLDDWYNSESKEALSEPFGEFFYPLYNKDGADGFNIINETNYALVIMVQGKSDCYSYFVESKSSYEEYFDLEKDDEIMFYFGKEYEETEDLDESEIAGFHYVDNNSKMYLDSIYVIGFGINPDRHNEDDSFDYEIKISEKDGQPMVSFDYYRTVKIKEEDFY